VSTDPLEVTAAFRTGLGATYTFLSDHERRAISQLDIVEMYEELLGTQLERSYLPAEQLERMHAEGRTPLEISLAGVMLNAARGGYVDASDVSSESGIRLTPMREFVAGQLT